MRGYSEETVHLFMSLFDEKTRVETRPRRENEGSFDYMNSSARPGISAIRYLLEYWFEYLPNAAIADVRARFRSRDEVQHQSALYELFWHELLRAHGYAVDVHPELTGVRTNPDFLAIQNGIPKFYLEATLAMPPGDSAGDRRLAELHDTLNRMDSPDYFLDVEYRGSPAGNIRGRLVRERLEQWLQQLDFEQISQLYRRQNFEAIPQLAWEDQGLLLTFQPIPKGPQFRGQPGARSVGMVMPMELRELRTHDDIRAAVEGKSTKYGDVALPLVVTVNVLDDFCDDADIRNALFGEEQVVAVRQSGGQWRHSWGTRVPDGVWYGRNGPRNTLVSAVVVTHQLSPSTLHTRAVEVFHNPWAAHPLLPDLLLLPQITICLPRGDIQRTEGASAANILNIPNPWPVYE
jgi:hypothetical protein